MTTETLETTDLVLHLPDSLSADARASLEETLVPIFDAAQPLCIKATAWGVGFMLSEDGEPPHDLKASAIASWNQRAPDSARKATP